MTTHQVRRRPVQDRAARRLESLLDAAARVLEREGLDGVTTSAIAREAGAAVGTVYTWFPNKEAVLGALLERYRERLGAALTAALVRDPEGSVDRAIETTVEVFVAFYLSEPGYAPLWLGSQATEALREAGAAWTDEFSDLVAAALASRTGIPPGRAPVVARVLAIAVSAIVNAGLMSDDPELISEAARIAKAYVHAVMDPSL